MRKQTLYFLGLMFLLLVIGISSQIHRDIPVTELVKKYGQPPSKFINIDGMSVHYRDEGQGYPVVLIHGMSSSLQTWQGWTDVLSTRYRVIRMDLPAFGLTGPNPTNDYSAEFYTSFIQTFLDSLGIKECYMAGNSLGGFITWEYTVAHPDQVKKIILVDAAGYANKKPPVIFTLARNGFVSTIMRYLTPRSLIAKNLHEVYGDPDKVSKETIDRYFALALREGNRPAFISYVGQFKNHDTGPLAQIKVPTLIEWGEKDHWIPLDNAEKFHHDITGSQLITYPGVGHVPQEEDPASSVRDALKFFSAPVDSVAK